MSHDRPPEDVSAEEEYLSLAPENTEQGMYVESTEDTILNLETTGDQASEVLVERAETVSQSEKSEFEGFKDNIRDNVSGLADRAKSLWGRIKGGASATLGGATDALWKGAYGAYKAPSAITETAVDAKDAVVESAIDIRDSVVEKARDIKDSVIETKDDVIATAQFIASEAVEKARDARDSVVETAVAGKDAVVGGAKAVGRGLETGAMITIGAGILAGEAVGRGIGATVELGERGIDAGVRFVESGIEKARQAKERAIEKLNNAKVATTTAVTSVAHAAETKTIESVNSGKEAIRNGVNSIVEGGIALKERASEGLFSAWEKIKNKKNMLKRGILGAKMGWNESQGIRLSEKASKKFAKANISRAALDAIKV